MHLVHIYRIQFSSVQSACWLISAASHGDFGFGSVWACNLGGVAWRDEDGGGGGVCRLGACATLKTFARFDNSESFSGCSAVVALMRFASALNGSPAARQCRVGQVDVALHLPLSFPSPWTDCANS